MLSRAISLLGRGSFLKVWPTNVIDGAAVIRFNRIPVEIRNDSLGAARRLVCAKLFEPTADAHQLPIVVRTPNVSNDVDLRPVKNHIGSKSAAVVPPGQPFHQSRHDRRPRPSSAQAFLRRRQHVLERPDDRRDHSLLGTHYPPRLCPTLIRWLLAGTACGHDQLLANFPLQSCNNRTRRHNPLPERSLDMRSFCSRPVAHQPFHHRPDPKVLSSSCTPSPLYNSVVLPALQAPPPHNSLFTKPSIFQIPPPFPLPPLCPPPRTPPLAHEHSPPAPDNPYLAATKRTTTNSRKKKKTTMIPPPRSLCLRALGV